MGIIINGQNDTIGPVDNSMSLLGTVSIGGTMTIEDFTNIDSVGLITARNGVNVTAGDVNLTSGNLALASATPMVVASNGSGSLRLGAGGSEKVRINSAGNIGIASDTPAARLDVYKDFNGVGAGTYAGRVYGLDLGVNETGVRFVTKGTGDLHNASDAYLMHGISNGTTRFVFGANGNVGINETSPDTYLHVKTGTDSALAKLEQTATNGRVQIQYLSPHGNWYQGIVGASNSGDYLIYTGQSKNLTFHTNGELRQKIQSDGKVILGGNANQSANRDLSVVAAPGNSNEAQIGLQPTNSSGGYNPEVFISAIADGTYGAHMFFKTRDTSGNRLERLRITSDGKIGIGVGSPLQMMEITNTGGTGTQIQLRDTSTGTGSSDGLRVGYNGSGGQMWNFENTYIRFATNNVERLRIQNDGNVIPLSNGAYNLGLSSYKWNKVWTNYVRHGTRSATYERTFTATSDGSGNLTFECGVLWLIDDSSFEVFCHIDRTGTYNSIAARYKFYGSKVSGFGTQGTYRSDTSNYYIISPMSNPTIDDYTPSGLGSSHGTRIRHTSAAANAEYRLTMLINWVGQREVT